MSTADLSGVRRTEKNDKSPMSLMTLDTHVVVSLGSKGGIVNGGTGLRVWKSSNIAEEWEAVVSSGPGETGGSVE